MKASFCSLLAAAVLLACPRAAQAAGRAVQVELSGAPGCIDGAVFRGRLASRPQSTVSVEAPRAATVRIVKHEGLYTGELEVMLADGATTVRQVASTRCDEVTDALSLVAALALGVETAPVVAPAPVTPSSAPVAPPSAPTTPPSAPTVLPRPVAAPPAPAEVVVVLPPKKPSAPSRWRFVGAVEGAVLAGYGPSVELSPAAAVTAELDAIGVVAPAITLRATGSASSSSTPGASTNVSLAQAALSVCPIRGRVGPVAFRPCAEVEAGVFAATATGATLTVTSQSQPWVALAPLAQAEWHIGRHFIIEANGGPVFPLMHPDFHIQGFIQSPVYTVRTVTGVARLGVGVAWP